MISKTTEGQISITTREINKMNTSMKFASNGITFGKHHVPKSVARVAAAHCKLLNKCLDETDIHLCQIAALTSPTKMNLSKY